MGWFRLVGHFDDSQKLKDFQHDSGQTPTNNRGDVLQNVL